MTSLGCSKGDLRLLRVLFVFNEKIILYPFSVSLRPDGCAALSWNGVSNCQSSCHTARIHPTASCIREDPAMTRLPAAYTAASDTIVQEGSEQ